MVAGGFKRLPSVVFAQSGHSFKNFFQGRSKYITFKKKHSRQSARYTTSGFSFCYGQIKLAKHKEPLNIRWSREFSGKPSSATVSKDAAGRYHISILVEEAVKPMPFVKKEVGIDLGLTHAVITNDGMKVNNQQVYKKLEKRLVKAQSSLSRKKKGCKNKEKARLKVARVHTKITDQRTDYAHKLTTQLVSENQVIAAESLRVKNMLKNYRLAKAIQDVGWFQITRMLEYKAQWHGRSFVQIDKFYPSSKRCNVCGQHLRHYATTSSILGLPLLWHSTRQGHQRCNEHTQGGHGHIGRGRSIYGSRKEYGGAHRNLSLWIPCKPEVAISGGCGMKQKGVHVIHGGEDVNRL